MNLNDLYDRNRRWMHEAFRKIFHVFLPIWAGPKVLHVLLWLYVTFVVAQGAKVPHPKHWQNLPTREKVTKSSCFIRHVGVMLQVLYHDNRTQLPFAIQPHLPYQILCSPQIPGFPAVQFHTIDPPFVSHKRMFLWQAGIALVYLVNVVPSLTMKLTGPYWFHYVSYRRLRGLTKDTGCAATIRTGKCKV